MDSKTDKTGEFWLKRLGIFLFPIHLIFSRPGRSQGLLYKHLCHSLINSFTDPLVKQGQGNQCQTPGVKFEE